MPRHHNINGNRVHLQQKKSSKRQLKKLLGTMVHPDRAMADLRYKRDSLLAASDWEMIADLE
jgi:hypothetical protein